MCEIKTSDEWNLNHLITTRLRFVFQRAILPVKFHIPMHFRLALAVLFSRNPR